jgi:hypothetical protein
MVWTGALFSTTEFNAEVERCLARYHPDDFAEEVE